MPQIGPLEILVVSVVALIVLGPRRLPEIARQVGRTMAEFRRHLSDIKGEFDVGLEDPDERVPGTPSGQRSTAVLSADVYGSAQNPESGPLPDRGPESMPPPDQKPEPLPEPSLTADEESADDGRP
ncbi:MAG: Sec-independent protein translocase protein TatB [Actinomycetota bacterium]